MKTLIIHHDDCLRHDPGPHHPERVERVAAVLGAVSGIPGTELLPAPRAAGEAEAFEVPGLEAGTTYYLAVRALDEWGNPGPVSNPASGLTLPPPAASSSASLPVSKRCGQIPHRSAMRRSVLSSGAKPITGRSGRAFETSRAVSPLLVKTTMPRARSLCATSQAARAMASCVAEPDPDGCKP